VHGQLTPVSARLCRQGDLRWIHRLRTQAARIWAQSLDQPAASLALIGTPRRPFQFRRRRAVFLDRAGCGTSRVSSRFMVTKKAPKSATTRTSRAGRLTTWNLYWVGNLRLVLDVQVRRSKQHTSNARAMA